jgi:uncharacterized protein DUF4375
MGGERFLERYEGQTTEQLLALESECRIDSLVLAFEEAIQRKETITPEERYILAVEGLEREVNNGGYSQFFTNSSNEFTDVIEAALLAIGCPKVAAITHDAIRGRADEEALADCDDRYYACDEPIADRLFAWITENRASIRVGGE